MYYFLAVLKFAFTVVGEADGEYEEESIEIFEAEEETLVEWSYLEIIKQ